MGMARNWRHMRPRIEGTNIQCQNRSGVRIHDKNETGARSEFDQSYKALDVYSTCTHPRDSQNCFYLS